MVICDGRRASTARRATRVADISPSGTSDDGEREGDKPIDTQHPSSSSSPSPTTRPSSIFFLIELARMQDFQSIPGLPGRLFGAGNFRGLRPYGPAAAAQAPVKCPRCESTNTKFCYYNNYNLSQPRHFCKSCRRYWTMGGVLRNVPVGGGCRKSSKRAAAKNGAAESNKTSPKCTATTTSSGDSAGSTTLPAAEVSAGAADVGVTTAAAPEQPPVVVLGRATTTPSLSYASDLLPPPTTASEVLPFGYLDHVAPTTSGPAPELPEWEATHDQSLFFDIASSGEVSPVAPASAYWNMGTWTPDVGSHNFYGLP